MLSCSLCPLLDHGECHRALYNQWISNCRKSLVELWWIVMSCVLIGIINCAKLLSWLLNLQRETFCCYQSSIQTPLGDGVVERGSRITGPASSGYWTFFNSQQRLQLQVQLIKLLIWWCQPYNYTFCWARHPSLMYGRKSMTGDDVSACCACSLVWEWWPMINAGVVLYTLHRTEHITF